MGIRRGAALTCAAATAFVLLVAVAPATARWSIHSDNLTEITAPAGGTDAQTCTDHLRAKAGWGLFVSPDQPAPDPLPAEAFDPINYELWKAPPGFSDFGDAIEEVDGDGNPIYAFYDINGVRSTATPVKEFTSPPRTELATPIPVNEGLPTGDTYVLTSSVEFTEPLTGVSPGEVLGIKPIGGQNFINLTAINCSPTETYTFKGYYSPVNNPPTVNLGTAGKTYPLRFSLKDASGSPVSELSAISRVRTQRVFCSTFDGKPTDRLEVAVSGGTSLRYNAATGRFVYKWKTYSQGCFSLTVVLADDQEFPGFFRLR